METLSNLLGNPLEAVSGLVETVLGDSSPPTATAAGSVPNPTFTEDTLRMILHNIFTGDGRLQGQMLSRYWAPNATYTLNQGQLSLPDRDALGQLLRGVTLLTSIEPEVLELTSTTDKAVVLLNLSLSYKAVPLTWSRYTHIQVPTTLCFTFGPDPSAVIASTDSVITALHQKLSLPDLVYWNPLGSWLSSRLWAPVSGPALHKTVQLTDPFMSRFQAYTAGGAGYTQAAIWVAEDITRGLRGAPATQHLTNTATAAEATTGPQAAGPTATADATTAPKSPAEATGPAADATAASANTPAAAATAPGTPDRQQQPPPQSAALLTPAGGPEDASPAAAAGAKAAGVESGVETAAGKGAAQPAESEIQPLSAKVAAALEAPVA